MWTDLSQTPEHSPQRFITLILASFLLGLVRRSWWAVLEAAPIIWVADVIMLYHVGPDDGVWFWSIYALFEWAVLSPFIALGVSLSKVAKHLDKRRGWQLANTILLAGVVALAALAANSLYTQIGAGFQINPAAAPIGPD